MREISAIPDDITPLTSASHDQRVADLLVRARQLSGLSLRELAARAGTSHATLSAYEQSRKIPSATTLLRILEACNLEVDLALTPRIRHADGIDRGDELAQVLILAEQFPTNCSKQLELPPFRKSA